MRVTKAHYTDREGRKRQTHKWYVEFKDHQEVRQRVPAFKDKRASEEFGRKLERMAAFRYCHIPHQSIHG